MSLNTAQRLPALMWLSYLSFTVWAGTHDERYAWIAVIAAILHVVDQMARR